MSDEKKLEEVTQSIAVTKTPVKFSALKRTVEKAVTRVAMVDLPNEKVKAKAEIIEHRTVPDPSAEVGIMFGLTIGLPRKFEFARIDVSLKVPCAPEKRNEAFEDACRWTIEKIKEEVEKIRSTEKKTRKDDDEPVL